MALEVEDGTSKANAESYLSVADADSYWSALGAPASWTAATTTEKEQALRKATNYIDTKFGPDFRGVRSTTTQRLRFPRLGMYDDDGYAVASSGSMSIPQQLKDATAILAARAIDDSTLIVDQASGGGLEGESIKVGPIEISESFASSKDPQKQYVEADALLELFTTSLDSIVDRG